MRHKYALARSIPRELLAAHSVVSPWKSPLLIALVYAATFTLVAFANYTATPLGWIGAVVITAGLQHHLITLMHEGAHHCVHPNKRLNDFLAQALCAFPLGMQLKDYRFFHLQHHKYSGDPERDPEVAFYRATEIGYGIPHQRLRRTLISDLTGIATLRSLVFLARFTAAKVKSGELRPVRASDVVQGLIGVGLLLTLAYSLKLLVPFLTVWGAAMVFVTPVLVRWHGLGEHTGENAELEQHKTLTHNFNPITNFFLYPIRSGYHLEHHLFAQIPWYEITLLRKKLLARPDYLAASKELSVDGYWWGEKSVRKVIL